MRRANSFKKTLMLGKIEGRRRRGQPGGMVGWHHRLNGHELEQAGRWWRTGPPGMLQFTGSQRVRHNWATEQQPFCKTHWLWQFKCAFPNWKCIWFLTWQPRMSPFQAYLLSNCCVQRKHCTRPQERCVWLSSPKSITQGYSQIFLENFSQTRHIHLTSTESKIWICKCWEKLRRW